MTQTGEGPRDLRLVWVALDEGSPDLSSVSAEERARADRFRFPADRRRFLGTRAALRAALGEATGQAPGEVKLVFGVHGKPGLERPGAVRFNLAHSHERALIGLFRGHEIGVDLEWSRPDWPLDELARRAFSPREQEALQSLERAERIPAFYRCWTRKEAFLKALGSGLARPLDSFDVTLAPGEPAAIVATRPDAGEALRYLLRDVDAPPGYTAAVALELPPETAAR